MRTNQQIKNHQGALTVQEVRLANRFKAHPKLYFTTWDVCASTGCVSGRDVVRKLQANGVPIGPAKLLHTNEDGTRTYGWRISK